MFLNLDVTSQPLQTNDFCKILIHSLFWDSCWRIFCADMQASCSVGRWEEGLRWLGFPMVVFLWLDERIQQKIK